MVGMVQYDRSEGRVEVSVYVSEQEFADLDIQIETALLMILFLILSMLKKKFQLHHVVDKIV